VAGEPELVAIPHAFPAGQDGVQVVVHGKVAAAEPVGVARGQPGDEHGHQARLGAPAGPQLLPDPRVHPVLGRTGRCGTGQARSDRPIGVMPGWTLKTRTPMRLGGEHELAAELARRAVAAAPADPFGQSTVLECLAAVHADEGQHELAVRLAAALAAFVDRAGMKQPPSVRELTEPVQRACRETLGADGFGSAWS
jgi:hypothetical protein